MGGQWIEPQPMRGKSKMPMEYTFTGNISADQMDEIYKRLQEVMQKHYKEIDEKRKSMQEALALALLAQFGWDVSEVELVETRVHDTITWSFRKKGTV